MTQDMDHVEEPLSIEATSGNSFGPLFDLNLNSSPIMRKSLTPTSFESYQTSVPPHSNNLAIIPFQP